mgnify:CR=1 FL=1
MNNKTFTIIGLVVVIAAAFFIFGGSDQDKTANTADVILGEGDLETPAPVKEFALTSSYETKSGKASASFSLKEIEVKKGDLVRIKVTNAGGVHDFNIDEYGITAETPENQATVIEFTADKVGEFKYYCSKYNHRELGQEGTLLVTE